VKNTILTPVLLAALALTPSCKKEGGGDGDTAAKKDDGKAGEGENPLGGDTKAAAAKPTDTSANTPAAKPAAAGGMQKRTSPEGGYTVMAATSGTQQVSSTDTPAGPARTLTVMYSGPQDPGALMVMYMDMPVPDGTPLAVDKGLEDGRDRAVGTYNGKLTSDKRIEVDGFPAREFEFDAKMPGVGEIHAIMRGAFRDKRVYMVGGVARKTDVAYQKKAKEFVHSFEILPYQPKNKTPTK
jgi:hypothetical protein